MAPLVSRSFVVGATRIERRRSAYVIMSDVKATICTSTVHTLLELRALGARQLLDVCCRDIEPIKIPVLARQTSRDFGSRRHMKEETFSIVYPFFVRSLTTLFFSFVLQTILRYRTSYSKPNGSHECERFSSRASAQKGQAIVLWQHQLQRRTAFPHHASSRLGSDPSVYRNSNNN